MLCQFLVYSKVLQLYIYHIMYMYYMCYIIYVIFHILFHYGVLQDIEYSSMSYKWDFVVYLFYVQQCVSANPKLLIYPSSTPSPVWGNHKFVFHVSVSAL